MTYVFKPKTSFDAMSLYVSLITPKRTLYDDYAEEAILPSNTGQVGILPQHANLVSCLDIGVMSLKVQNTWCFFACLDGFLSVERDRVLVLVNGAEGKDDIDPDEAERELEQAQQEVQKAGEGKSKQRAEAQLALRRARTRYAVSQA